MYCITLFQNISTFFILKPNKKLHICRQSGINTCFTNPAATRVENIKCEGTTHHYCLCAYAGDSVCFELFQSNITMPLVIFGIWQPPAQSRQNPSRFLDDGSPIQNPVSRGCRRHLVLVGAFYNSKKSPHSATYMIEKIVEAHTFSTGWARNLVSRPPANAPFPHPAGEGTPPEANIEYFNFTSQHNPFSPKCHFHFSCPVFRSFSIARARECSYEICEARGAQTKSTGWISPGPMHAQNASVSRSSS